MVGDPIFSQEVPNGVTKSGAAASTSAALRLRFTTAVVVRLMRS